jgi:hypothetical protein
VSLTNAYCSLADVKAALRIDPADTVDDAMLSIAINAASRQIDGECDRVFYQSSGSRVYVPESSVLVNTDDIRTVTKLETSSGDGFTVEIPSTDFQLEPLNGVAGGIPGPFTRIRATGAFLFPVFSQRSVNLDEATVRVTGTFGWAAVPDAIRQAALLLSIRVFKRLDSPLAVAGFGDLGAIRVSRTDPDVMALIQPYVRGTKGIG